MTGPPRVSVIVPHFGDPGQARALVESLLATAGVVDLEVVVVDDASPQPFGDPFPGRPAVRVVRRTVNGGFGAAVNTGAELARHELLLVLNSDLELPTGFVDELVVAASPHLPALVAPTVVSGSGRRSSGHRFPRPRAQAVEWVSVLGRWQGRRWFDRAIGLTPPPVEGWAATDWVSGEAFLVDAASFHAAGGFDESYFMYVEEVDLQRRLAALGVPRLLLATTPVVHRRGGSSDPARTRAWLVSARFQDARRLGEERRLRAALTAATTVNLVVNVVRRLAGRDVHPLLTAREELRLVWRVGRVPPQSRAT